MPKDSKYHQGRYRPHNPDKYMGDAANIIYRSSWELHFYKWCDTNDAVLKWASEEFSIPYVSPIDNRVHRYYPDGIVQIRHKDGNVVRYIIEIKPARQCVEPIRKSRVTKSYINECKTYAVNQAKWHAGAEFAKDNGVQFKVLTEHDLGIPQPKKRRKRN